MSKCGIIVRHYALTLVVSSVALPSRWDLSSIELNLSSIYQNCISLLLPSLYNRKVRTELLQHYGRNKKFYLKRKRFDSYRSEMARSLFCLCPLGWAPWSPRLVESVLLGCIPVVIARLPFPSIVRWQDISLQVAEKDIASLEMVLDHGVATNLTVIQRNLWGPVKRKALIFNRPMEVGDATWQVLRELEVLLDRSQRRRYAGSWRR
jgi:probable glucuronoxylan glucuronosyltransferase IRX7